MRHNKLLEDIMKPNEVNEVLREYLKHKNTNYAILIDGEWGSGKTYYIR